MFADQSSPSPELGREVNDIRHLNERRSLALSGAGEEALVCRMTHNRTRLSGFGEKFRPITAQITQPTRGMHW